MRVARDNTLTLFNRIRRAFAEFLTIPTVTIAGFAAIAAITWQLDQAWMPEAQPGSDATAGALFRDPKSASDLLGVIASSIITVTSITLSLLLIAVQQGATSLSSQVFDQFLRRTANQFYFGFFIGLAVYSLIILATVGESHVPVYGVSLALVFVVVALCMLVLLIYSTIDQMRPVVIIKAIHDHTLVARQRQQHLLQRTRRRRRLDAPVVARIDADGTGFLARVNVAEIEAAVHALEAAEVEIVILRSIGDHVTFGGALAEISCQGEADLGGLTPAVRSALQFESQRDIENDPAFGIQQLVTVGWTSVSTAKSDPQPGLLACWSLSDLLARCFMENARDDREPGSEEAEPAPVVYADNVGEELLAAFESLAVVASESMQHQTAAELYCIFAEAFPRLPPAMQDRAEDLLLRSLSALGEHVPTRVLDTALSRLADALRHAGRLRAADAVQAARKQLSESIGLLNSRGTRAGRA